jgi:N-acetyl-anhydromuramyl-L-alanine amidase AmpD
MPFYIIPLMHGAWHEPRRNKDSISIEYVNAGEIRKHNEQWCYWPNDWKKPIPETLVHELPPLTLDSIRTKSKSLQPFTQEQLICSIKIKRIVNSAFPGKLDDSRMSQHSDWRDGKSDMGPLFPLDDINDFIWDAMDVRDLAFIKNYEDALDEIGDYDEEIDESENPETGIKEPTQDKDDKEPKLLTTMEIQEILFNLGYAIDVDGLPGKKTRGTLKIFQATYNNEHGGTLTFDGIAGPRTCVALRKMRGEEEK